MSDTLEIPRESRATQKHRRTNCRIEVEVTAGLMQERAASFDISAGGMFIDTAQDYALDQVVTVTFAVAGRTITCDARIIHLQPRIGFGAEFLAMDGEDRRHLLRFVHTERATAEARELIATVDHLPS